MEKIIYSAGRQCYSDDNAIDIYEKADDIKIGKFIQARINEGHDSILEHGVFTFSIEGISRACLAQLTRHRISSYSVSSQRYNELDNFSYVIPETIKNNQLATEIFLDAMDFCQNWYNQLIELGIPKEDARYVIPNACETKLVMTINCRSLRNLFKLRLDIHAQQEIRQLANEMLKFVKQIAPNVFYDFEVIK
jgi:thymidylate synthase (FAD)